MLSCFFILIFTAQSSETKVDLYNQKKQEYLNKEEMNRDILSEIYKMQKRLKKINHDKNQTLVNKKNIDDQIARLQPIVDLANKKIMGQKIDIQKRLQYIYKFQDMSFLKIFFSAQAPSDLDRNLRILKNLTEHDYKNLKSYFKNIKTLNAKRIELEKKRKSALLFQVQIDKKETLLVSESKRKNILLAKIEKQKKKLLTKLKTIRDQTHKDKEDVKREEFLGTLFDPLFFEKKGMLTAPIRKKIFQSYGEFKHPIYNTQFRHKGIFFKSKNDDVKAVAKGEVVHIEKIPGQGFTLIVDHGDHYYSVYSHLSDVRTQMNQVLTEGQEIGETGAFHPFFGAGLYFELRHFSEPINPTEWFKL